MSDHVGGNTPLPTEMHNQSNLPQQAGPTPTANHTGKDSSARSWVWIAGVMFVVVVVGLIFGLFSDYAPSGTASGVPSYREVPERPKGSPGTRDEPIPMGQPVDVGSGWTMTVNSVNLDADEDVEAADDFNDPAAEGSSYVIINVSLAYDGQDDPATVDIEIAAVGRGTNVAVDERGVYAIPPAPELESYADVYKGGTIEGNIVLAVDDDDLDTLEIVARPNEYGNNFRTYFATR